jgi:hypothetical protein
MVDARKVLLEIADELETNASRRSEEYQRDFVSGIIRAQRDAAALPVDDVLPKPDHVEEGQMWTRWDDHRTVEGLHRSGGRTEAHFDNGRWEHADRLLTSPDWRYLGKKVSQ